MTITLKNTLIKCCAIATMAVMAESCSKPSAPGIYKNDEIQSGVRKTLHTLNDDLLLALKKDDRHGQELLMTQEFIDDVRLRVKISAEATIRMQKADYSLLQEYYLVSPVDTGITVIKDRSSGVNNYDLEVPTLAKEMYVAQFVAKDAGLSWMITATYHKKEYGWKIDDMEISPYSQNKRTAPEQIDFAKKMMDKKYYLDANNAMAGAIEDLYPAIKWRYVKHDEITKTADIASGAVSANQPLPFFVTEVATGPQVWRVTIEHHKEGAFPNINYVSKISLLDTMALKKENVALGKVIGKYMPGVDKDKKYVFYTIYNKSGKGENTGKVDIRDHYDLRQDL